MMRDGCAYHIVEITEVAPGNSRLDAESWPVISASRTADALLMLGVDGDSLMAAPTTRTATANRILDVAERLAQTRGFNGFSYADIAGQLGVTKASLHYHFPTKADLGTRLIQRYRDVFTTALAAIDASGVDARAKLRAYVAIYSAVLSNNRMCLCGMLAADYATL